MISYLNNTRIPRSLCRQHSTSYWCFSKTIFLYLQSNHSFNSSFVLTMCYTNEILPQDFTSAILLRALPALNQAICPSFIVWFSCILSTDPSLCLISHCTGWKKKRKYNNLSGSKTKPTNDVCAQQILRSACQSAQSNQSLCCALNGKLRTHGCFTQTRRLWSIRLGRCPGWSESLLGTQVILLILSGSSSFS